MLPGQLDQVLTGALFARITIFCLVGIFLLQFWQQFEGILKFRQQIFLAPSFLFFWAIQVCKRKCRFAPTLFKFNLFLPFVFFFWQMRCKVRNWHKQMFSIFFSWGCIVIVITFIWLSSAVCFDSQVQIFTNLNHLGSTQPFGPLDPSTRRVRNRVGASGQRNFFGGSKADVNSRPPFKMFKFPLSPPFICSVLKMLYDLLLFLQISRFSVYMIFLPFQLQYQHNLSYLWYLLDILEQLQRSYCLHKLCPSECRTKTLELKIVRFCNIKSNFGQN